MAPHDAAMAALARGDVAAVAALTLFTLLLAVLLARVLLQRARRNAVLLLGPCGVGKTALFGRVRSTRSLQKYISLNRPCVSRCVLSSRHSCKTFSSSPR